MSSDLAGKKRNSSTRKPSSETRSNGKRKQPSGRKNETIQSSNDWSSYVDGIASTLLGLKVTPYGASLEQWVDATLDVRTQGADLYIIGNGASASMASHCAADLAKNGKMRTHTPHDPALLTCLSNDYSYAHAMLQWLWHRLRRRDMLVCISSSGMSENILNAAAYAADMGCYVATLSAFSPQNELRRLGTLNLWCQTNDYGFAETCHAAILHRWIDLTIAG